MGNRKGAIVARRRVFRAAATLSILGCALAGDARTLTILAAASLRESFKELAHTFEASHPGEHVRITFAGSQQLAASILSGAPADVFASADELQTKRVVSGGKAGYVTALCSNRLVVAVNKKSANQIHSIADLGRPGLRVVLAKLPVPAGVYSEKLLAKLPASQAAAIRANIRSREADVRTVLARVEMGEADAGIVYATDVRAVSGAVVSIPIATSLQTPVMYVITTMSKSSNPGLATEFIKLVLSKGGQAVLRAHGFLPPPQRRL